MKRGLEADLTHQAGRHDEIDERPHGFEGRGQGLLAHDRLARGDGRFDGRGVGGRRAGHENGVDIRVVDRQGEIGSAPLEGAVAVRCIERGGRRVDGGDRPDLPVGDQLGKAISMDLPVRATTDERDPHPLAGHPGDGKRVEAPALVS